MCWQLRSILLALLTPLALRAQQPSSARIDTAAVDTTTVSRGVSRGPVQAPLPDSAASSARTRAPATASGPAQSSQLISDSIVQRLQAENENLRRAKVRDSLSAETLLELSPTGGLKVKGFPIWIAVLLALATFAFLVFTFRSADAGGAKGLGTITVVVGIVAAFMFGSWWARRGIDRDLREVLGQYRVEVQNPAVAEVVPAPVEKVGRESAAAAPTQTSESLSAADNRLLTPGMMWALILSVVLVVLLFTFSRLRIVLPQSQKTLKDFEVRLHELRTSLQRQEEQTNRTMEDNKRDLRSFEMRMEDWISRLEYSLRDHFEKRMHALEHRTSGEPTSESKGGRRRRSAPP